MPVFDMIETVMVHKGIVNTRLRRLGYRSLYVVCLCVAGAGIPYFGGTSTVLLSNAPVHVVSVPSPLSGSVGGGVSVRGNHFISSDFIPCPRDLLST